METYLYLVASKSHKANNELEHRLQEYCQAGGVNLGFDRLKSGETLITLSQDGIIDTYWSLGMGVKIGYHSTPLLSLDPGLVWSNRYNYLICFQTDFTVPGRIPTLDALQGVADAMACWFDLEVLNYRYSYGYVAFVFRGEKDIKPEQRKKIKDVLSTAGGFPLTFERYLPL